MSRIKDLAIIVASIFIVTSSIVIQIGCSNNSDQQSPVSIIKIFKLEPGTTGIPTGGWGVQVGPPEPFPSNIQRIFTPGDKMELGISINLKLDQNVTFSKYTFFNRESGNEFEVGSLKDLGPYEPGQVVIVVPDNHWLVPDEVGIYEVRIYLGNAVVASAVFELQ